MEIDKELYKEIKEYCDINGIKPKKYVTELLKKAFMEDKYGISPFKKSEDVIVSNDAFKDAVNSEVRRILSSPKGELEEILNAGARELKEPENEAAEEATPVAVQELKKAVKDENENPAKKRTITPLK